MSRGNHHCSRISDTGIRISVLLTLITFSQSCGTRAGNPKKPGNDTRQTVVIPTIGLEIPDELGQASLKLTAADDTASNVLDTVPRASMVVKSLNAMINRINQSEVALNEILEIKTDHGSVSGIVKEAQGDATYHKKGIFCVDGKPFFFAAWNDAGTVVKTVRHFAVNPYGSDDPGMANTREMTTEAIWRKEGPWNLETWARSELTGGRRQLFKDYQAANDYWRGKLLADGSVDVSGVVDYEKAGAPSDLDPEQYIAGRLRKDRAHSYIFHFEGFPLLCTGSIDETNPDNPGWCHGVRLAPGTETPVRLLQKNEVDAVWGSIRDIGLAEESNLKVVTMPEEAACP